MTIPKDALQNDIIIGQKYGYTTSKSGWQVNVIGEATSFSEKTKKVTLMVLQRYTYLYGEPSDHPFNDSVTVSVRSLNLFPVEL